MGGVQDAWATEVPTSGEGSQAVRIAHNLAALTAWRQVSTTQNELTRSLERLSSGRRINRAADDAAGLAIAEKMRSQARGLDQGIRNGEDGISLLQTAEGALAESHALLERMRELALQAANDTLTVDDRLAIQKEMDQLARELSRITNTTEFNNKNLLGGAFTDQAIAAGAGPDQALPVSIAPMDAASLGVAASRGVYVLEGDVITSATFTAGPSVPTDTYLISGTWFRTQGTAFFNARGSTEFLGVGTFSTPDGTLTVSGPANAFTVTLADATAGTTQTTASWNPWTGLLSVELRDDGTNVVATWSEVVEAIKRLPGFYASFDGSAVATASEGSFQARGGGSLVVTGAMETFSVSVENVLIGNTVTTATWDPVARQMRVELRDDGTSPVATWLEVVNAINGAGAGLTADFRGDWAGPARQIYFEGRGGGTLTINAPLDDFQLALTNSVTNATLSLSWRQDGRLLHVELADWGGRAAPSWRELVEAINNFAQVDFEASFQGDIDWPPEDYRLLWARDRMVRFSIQSYEGRQPPADETIAVISPGQTSVDIELGGLALTLSVPAMGLDHRHVGDSIPESLVDVVAEDPTPAVPGPDGKLLAPAQVIKGALVTRRDLAQEALGRVDGAIGQVSAQRAYLGAVQNRLRHAVNNLGVAAENLTAAESRIRDLDMALQMVELVRNQIVLQVGVTMLAQANIQPQTVLQLLGK